jgi:hypothetical protein
MLHPTAAAPKIDRHTIGVFVAAFNAVTETHQWTSHMTAELRVNQTALIGS